MHAVSTVVSENSHCVSGPLYSPVALILPVWHSQETTGSMGTLLVARYVPELSSDSRAGMSGDRIQRGDKSPNICTIDDSLIPLQSSS